jgi:hypothetical protein
VIAIHFIAHEMLPHRPAHRAYPTLCYIPRQPLNLRKRSRLCAKSAIGNDFGDCNDAAFTDTGRVSGGEATNIRWRRSFAEIFERVNRRLSVSVTEANPRRERWAGYEREGLQMRIPGVSPKASLAGVVLLLLPLEEGSRIPLCRMAVFRNEDDNGVARSERGRESAFCLTIPNHIVLSLAGVSVFCL